MSDRTGQHDSAAIGRLRLVIARLHRQMVQSLGEQDLTPAQLSALARIEQYGPIRPGELAALEGVAAPSMIRTLTPLTRAGLIGKEPDRQDGRSFFIRATAAGHERLATIRRERSALLAQRLDHLTPEQRDLLYAAIPVLELLVDEGGGPGAPAGDARLSPGAIPRG
ncbi:MarR family transcriptional regulator [Nonomuraea sp. B12E4]|uniref:MarR family winged helix-turn-helix transcriptional regulator n=1 Tax=Nonomuraea sp. B12E4 TaxID=3153564 RepID=UPI00325E126F